MAKVITWHEPYAVPTNFTATAVAGGSLADDTYYFRIFAVNDAGERDPLVQGVITAEINATTSGSDNSIDLSWDAVAGSPYGYVILVSTTSEDYGGTGRMIKSDSGSYFFTTTGTTWNYDGTESKYYNFHPFNCVIDFPAGLDKNNGRGYIEVSGGTEEDPVTLTDINTAIGDTTYSVLDGRSWTFQGSIESKGGYFVAEDMNIWFAGWFYDTTTGNFRFGREETSYEATWYSHPCSIQSVGHSFMRPFARRGTFRFYGSSMIGCDTGNPFYTSRCCSTSSYGMSDSGMVFKQSYLWYTDVVWYSNVVIENTTITAEVRPYHIYTDFSNFKHCTLNRGIDLTSLTGADGVGGVFNYLDLVGYAYSDEHIYVRQDTTKKNYFINCTVPYPKAGHTGLPSIYWKNAHTYPATSFIYWQFTFNLKVVDVAGNPIVGASVVVKEVDGTEHVDSPLTTDANGEITEIIVTSCILQRNSTVKENAGGWDYTEQVNKYPYTVTVTKAGKLSKTVKYDITEATSDTMLLEKVKDLNFSRKGRLTLH